MLHRARRIVFQVAEVALERELFAAILSIDHDGKKNRLTGSLNRKSRMRRYAILGLAIVAVLVVTTVGAVRAQGKVTFPGEPGSQNFYVDEAGLIAQPERQAINEVAGALLSDEQIPVIVVTIPSLAYHNATGYTIERYAFELFNHWGIGSQERNYGMLLLVSKGDRRARIELGAAWGHSFNAQAQQVMDTLIIPRFKDGEFSEGTLAGVRGMDAMARGLELPEPERSRVPLIIFFVFLGVLSTVTISLSRSGRSGWGWAFIVLIGTIIVVLLVAAARSEGSGGSFGGGSSGGGGASGSW